MPWGKFWGVVIGILIALQLNSWNEQKKSNQQINAALAEIREDLNRDKIVLENQVALLKGYLTAQKKCFDY
jgi:hypothetical protein